MQFSILFWNIWLENQINDIDRSIATFKELERLVKQLQPDVIGLNEVLKRESEDLPEALSKLRLLGYDNDYYAINSNLSSEWLIGSTLSSRLPINSLQEMELGKDVDAARRGYQNCTVKGICANIKISNVLNIGTLIVHPHHLRHYTLKEHYRATETIKKLLQSPDFSSNTIIAGDFNEPVFLPKSFKSGTTQTLNHRTGNLKNPTWRLNGSSGTLIKANLDYIYWTKKGSINLIDFQIVDSKASDHKPLFAKFEITR